MTHARHQGEETSDEKREAQRYRSLCSRCDDGIVHSESRRGGDHSMISTSSFTHVGEPMPTPPSSSERLACSQPPLPSLCCQKGSLLLFLKTMSPPATVLADKQPVRRLVAGAGSLDRNPRSTPHAHPS